jgi:tRNA-dihydrouridine synthase 2
LFFHVNGSIDDVAAFDVNCGCPKHFSVHAGMGAALMKTPDLLESVRPLTFSVGYPQNNL